MEKIKQKELENEAIENEWEEDEFDDEAEVIKLQVGDSIEGLLVDKYPSTKYDVHIYKIKVKDDDLPKIVLGTTIIDKMMKNKEVGEPVKIERLEDKPSEKGKPIQQWKTYHKKKGNE